ncbi:uncharacterized protein RCC_03359 [Ramularia collo-cygni]|uniref:Monocarboxylate transporter n=1 Tax=Ramularia collo-cygni TaxID=112498 RepID=A0A2D3UU37_9PEZI|nr:uncharacterized protein RCC_03359 [Ramularia collo-cygni]CZT17525.1 uncharacterized protein RCC_03359 [Ramularia collo-cygni]
MMVLCLLIWSGVSQSRAILYQSIFIPPTSSHSVTTSDSRQPKRWTTFSTHLDDSTCRSIRSHAGGLQSTWSGYLSLGHSTISNEMTDPSDTHELEMDNRSRPGHNGNDDTNNSQTGTTRLVETGVHPGPATSLRVGHDGEQAQPLEIDGGEPQNGRTAWLHAATGFLVVANCWGIGNAWGLFQAYYEIVYLHGTPPSSIAWIGSTQLALVFGLGFPVGKLVDMGFFHTVFRTGSCLMVLGIFCTAWCKSMATLWVVQGLVTGIGMGCVFCSGITVMMTWFDDSHISIAFGFAAAGSCVGGIVYILLVRYILVQQGFPATMIVIGAMATVTMIPANVVFRIREEKPTEKPSSPFVWRTYLEPSYVLAAAGMFFAFMGVYFGFVYMVLYGVTVLHLSNRAATDLLIFMLTANLPGRFIPALISDKWIGPLNTIGPCALLSSIVLWVWTAVDTNRLGLTVIACVYGFVTAGVQVMYVSTVYAFCTEPGDEGIEMSPGGVASTRRAKPRLRFEGIGMRAGGLYTAIGLACLIGTPIGGALISYRTDRGLSNPYLGAQIFAGSSLLLGGLLLLASRVSKVGWRMIKV